MIKTDAMTKTQEDFFNKIFTTLLQGFEKVVWGFYCERELETET